MKAHVSGQAILIHGDGDEKLLVCEVDIDCEACGQHTLRFAGHHVPALLAWLASVAEEYAEILPKGLSVVDKMKFGGAIPNDPKVN